MIYLSQGKQTQAQTDLQNAARLGDPKANAILAQNFNSLGRNVNEDALALINKGDEEFQKNNFLKAIEFFSKAIQKDKTDWYPFFRRGKSYQLSNNFDNAIKDYFQGVSIDNNFDLNRGLGESYLMKSDFSNGKKFLLKAFDLLTKMEDIDKMGRSEKDFEKFKLSNYGWEKANLMNNLAVAYYNLDDTQEAFNCTGKGIEYDSSYAANYGIRGSIYLESGHHSDAINFLKKAASLGDNRSQSILDNLL